MSQIGSHSPGSGNLSPKARSHRQVVLRFGYADASYLFMVAAVRIGDTRTDGGTYLYWAVPALVLMLFASMATWGAVRLGGWPDRRMWGEGERRIRYRSREASVLSGAGRRPANEESSLPAWARAEPRVWHFAPLVLLCLWTLVVLLRTS